MRRKALSQELDELELELLELWFQEPTRLAPPCRVSHRRTAVPLVARFTNRGDQETRRADIRGGASHLRHRGRDSL